MDLPRCSQHPKRLQPWNCPECFQVSQVLRDCPKHKKRPDPRLCEICEMLGGVKALEHAKAVESESERIRAEHDAAERKEARGKIVLLVVVVGILAIVALPYYWPARSSSSRGQRPTGPARPSTPPPPLYDLGYDGPGCSRQPDCRACSSCSSCDWCSAGGDCGVCD